MKKIFLLLVLLNGIIFADGIYKEEEVFIRNGKTYLLKDDSEVNGTITSVKEEVMIYSTYDKGTKTKERVLNAKREIISEYFLDANGLINGKAYVTNENGEVITAEYKKGIINGNAKQEYYGEFDFEGKFVYGIAHGKVKSIDASAKINEHNYSTGIEKKISEPFLFNSYFEKEFVKKEMLKNEKDLMKKDGKNFTGLGFLSENGFVNEIVYYAEGIKKAEFYFVQGIIDSIKLYKTQDIYEEYLFYLEMNKGVLNSINSYEKGQLNGNFKVYYLNGDRQEGVYVNGELKGKGFYYNNEDKIIEIKEYKDGTYKSITYYDYEKGKISSTSEGIYNDELAEWIEIGKSIYYDENGYVEEELTYTNDNKVYSKTYYPSGKTKMTGEIDRSSDFYIGEINEYYESGVIKAKLNYTEGYLNGKQYYYDSEGNQTKVEEYDSGNLIN